MKRNSRSVKYCCAITITMLIMAFFNPITSNAEYQSRNQAKAETLKELGLIKGSEKGFELDRPPTRLEGSVMLVRLLGKESEALNKHYSHPFNDVPSWASDYVGYLYQNNLTNGMGNSQFGSNQLISSQAMRLLY